MSATALRVLIVGSGGREHALAWKAAQSPRLGHLFVAPGNAGAAQIATQVPIPVTDIPALVRFAQAQAIDLTLVGPEGPLAAGMVDAFQAAGLTIFGPRRAAAQLEASKAFAKTFMTAHAIPTAHYAVFRDVAAARRHLSTWPADVGVVVKASGLAAGKGVVVCNDPQAALPVIHAMLHEGSLGSAGQEIILEEQLTGPELSLLAFSDGQTVVPLLPARDHKRVGDGDVGPNTGGMGAYAPAPDVDAALVATLTRTILQPTVDGLAAAGTPYVGVLYAGLMLTPAGPRVLEFNCRLGDPETQALLPLLESDLLEVCLACVQGRLAETPLRFKAGACVTVVMSAAGYPGPYARRAVISGLEQAAAQPDVAIFLAGVARRADQWVTDGGRVLAVSALGEDGPTAAARAYAALAHIHFDGAHYRRDIGR